MKPLLARLAVVLVAMAIPFVSPSPVAAQPPLGTNCALFPADNILNTDVSGLPVNAQSQTWLSNMTQASNLHPDFGTFAQWYGIPTNVAPPPSGGVAPTFTFTSESDHPSEGYPIDQNTLIEGGPAAPSGSDRHALVVNKNLCKLYEIYNLQNFSNGQTPAAGSGAVWDLSSNAMRPIGWTSADAAGLPITPLLLRPDEILAGSIPHAIRFTTHCTHSYVWPGSHDAGLCGAGFPPMGARFRLRAGFNISSFSANTQSVLRALQHYGLILADNGADWYFQGTTDDWWGTTAGAQVISELKTIPAAQFDAVDEAALQVAPTSYQASGIASLTGSFAGAPETTAWAVNRLDMVGVGFDQQLWHRSWTGTTWGAWEALAGRITADPGAVSWTAGRLDVFGRGIDGALWHKWLDNGTWSGWEAVGGQLIGGPAAASSASGHLDVFVVGTDRALWQRSWDGTRWTAWVSLGGILTSDPTAASTGSNLLDVFGRGADNQVWHRSWNGSAWGAWQALGGVLTSAPEVAAQGPNRLDLFGRGSDNQLWHRAWNGTQWAVWEPLGGILTSSPGASSWGTNRVDVFVRGTDMQAWHKWWDGTSWSSWERIVGPPGG